MNEYFKYVLKNLKEISLGFLFALTIIVLAVLVFAIPILFIVGITAKQPNLCLISILGGIIVILVKSFFDMIGGKKK